MFQKKNLTYKDKNQMFNYFTMHTYSSRRDQAYTPNSLAILLLQPHHAPHQNEKNTQMVKMSYSPLPNESASCRQSQCCLRLFLVSEP